MNKLLLVTLLSVGISVGICAGYEDNMDSPIFDRDSEYCWPEGTH